MPEIIRPPIETILIEVEALILQHVPDMGSPWALMQASAHIYNIFRNYREHILPIIIARDIGPAVMVEALAALDSSRSFTSTQNVEGDEVEVPLRGPPKSQTLDWMENYYLPRSGVMMRWGVEDYPTESDRVVWAEWKKCHPTMEADSSLLEEDVLSLWDLHKDVKMLAGLYVRETLPIFT